MQTFKFTFGAICPLLSIWSPRKPEASQTIYTIYTIYTLLSDLIIEMNAGNHYNFTDGILITFLSMFCLDADCFSVVK